MTDPKHENTIIFILGAPGSGKGTICKKLSQDYGFCHFSAGDYLRQLGSDVRFHGREFIQSHIRDGELLPTEFLIPMLRTRIHEEIEMGNHCILVDGFPRNTSQAIAFREEVESDAFVILFNCPKETAKQRYLTRRLPGRLDDDEEMFEKRFTQFERLNPSVMEYFKLEANIEEIDSSTETEVTYARLLESVGKKYGWERKSQAVV